MPSRIILAAALVGFCSPASAGDRHDLVARYYGQFQKPGFEVDALMAFYADDVKFTDPTFEIVANGREEVRKLYADIGTGRTQYRNIVWTINDVVSDGDRVVISGNWAGEFWACPFSVDFMTFWRLEDGLIAEQRDFFAASAFDRQVAWDPAAGRATCGKEDGSAR